MEMTVPFTVAIDMAVTSRGEGQFSGEMRDQQNHTSGASTSALVVRIGIQGKGAYIAVEGQECHDVCNCYGVSCTYSCVLKTSMPFSLKPLDPLNPPLS